MASPDRREFLVDGHQGGLPAQLNDQPPYYIRHARTSPADLQTDIILFQPLIVHNGSVLLVLEDQVMKDHLKDESEGWCLPFQIWSRSEIADLPDTREGKFTLAESMEIWLVHAKTLVWKEGVEKEGFLKYTQGPGDLLIEGSAEKAGVRMMLLTIPIKVDSAIEGDTVESFKSYAQYRWVPKYELERAVIQRVKSASVTVDGQLISSIAKGILVFAAVGKDDTLKEAESMAGKVLKLKLWEDDQGGKWKKNVQEINGEVLCVSQFTLLASTKKGNKPDFHKSAPAIKGKELYNHFFARVRSQYREDRVKDGVFQAMMDVELINDGPVGLDYRSIDEIVTIEIETNPPEMKNPTEFTPFDGSLEDSGTFNHSGPLHKTFDLPASLLE
ncbi:D-tyrosyl-tRNA(Tyr) deacylase [Elasticomyces elasticus]|nr:D-tyrosyl-tRNA(Tyr) deacylase [Elasticomyces elasticus]